jgi:hypothetical protein
MTTAKWLASLVVTATIVPALPAESHCPGNVASLRFRLVNRYQIVLPVSINHSGPYLFLLDTGMQITAVDPSLAAQLHLQPQGTAVVAGTGSRQPASIAQLDLLEAGSHAVANPRVFVYDLKKLHIQGILGEDFLEHFDMLIDNVHGLLCLDDSGALRADVKGPHIALIAQAEPEQGSALPDLPIILVRLPDATRPVRLMLDSGANGAILYNTLEYLAPRQRGYLQGTGVDGKQLIFSALPPQNVKIGLLELSGVPFVSLAGTQTDARAKGFDGNLTLGLFRRVFIDHADNFAILEAR